MRFEKTGRSVPHKLDDYHCMAFSGRDVQVGYPDGTNEFFAYGTPVFWDLRKKIHDMYRGHSPSTGQQAAEPAAV